MQVGRRRTTPRAVFRRIPARLPGRIGAIVAAVALLVMVGCSPAAPQAIENASATATDADQATGSSETEASSAGDADGAMNPQILERVGNGRAVAAASAGATTVVATTIGVEIVDDDGRLALPVATMDPADRVAIAPDASTAVIGWSSATELWSLAEPPSLLTTTDPTRWVGLTTAGTAVLVSWSDVRVLDAADGAELSRVETPADRTIGVATADPDGAWWATALSGGPSAEILLSTAAGTEGAGADSAEPVAIDGTDGAEIEILTPNPAADQLLIGLTDPALQRPPELVAFDPTARSVAWSVPLAFDDRWGVNGDGEVLVVGSEGTRLVDGSGSMVAVDGEAPAPVAPLAVRGLPGGGFVTLFDDDSRRFSDADGRTVGQDTGLDRAVTPIGWLSGSGLTTIVDQLGLVDVIDQDGTVTRRIETYVGGRINDVAVSADGALAIATSAGSVRVLADTGSGVASGDPIASFEHPEGSVDGVAFSPDGSRVITGVAQRTGAESFDDTVVVWDRTSQEELQRVGGTGEDIAGCSSFVNPVTVSADGSFAIGVSHDFTAFLLDGESFERERLLSTHIGPILDVALSPDGTTLVTTSEDLTMRVIDVASGDLIDEFQTDLGGIRTASFLPSGDALVIGDLLGQLQILDVASGQITRTFDGAMSRDAVPEISPDGRLVAAGDGATLRIWSVETGQVVDEMLGHSGQVNTAAFTPDGTAVISGSTDGTVVVWDLRA